MTRKNKLTVVAFQESVGVPLPRCKFCLGWARQFQFLCTDVMTLPLRLPQFQNSHRLPATEVPST